MELLGLSSVESSDAPLQLVPPDTKKSPLLAFLLSLAFPGAGHLYLGLTTTAAWTAGLTLLSLLAFILNTGFFWSYLAWVAPSLYCFAMLDAFFAAREWNAGVGSRLVGGNPRIAAILNFLTKGFGYFYLGNRAKGVIVFVGVSIVQGLLLAFGRNPFLRILAISIQVAIAVDGYVRADRQLLETSPELRGDAIARANPGSLPQWVPLATAALTAGIVVVFFGSMQALTGRFSSDAQFASIDSGPEGNTYTNAHDHIRFTVPSDWSLKAEKQELALGLNPDSTCSIDLLMQYSLGSAPLTLEAQRKLIATKYKVDSYALYKASLGGEETDASVTTYTVRSDLHMVRRDIIFRRGLRLFTFIEVQRNKGCSAEMDAIEHSFQF